VHCIYLQLALKVYVEIIITGFFAIRISGEKKTSFLDCCKNKHVKADTVEIINDETGSRQL